MLTLYRYITSSYVYNVPLQCDTLRKRSSLVMISPRHEAEGAVRVPGQQLRVRQLGGQGGEVRPGEEAEVSGLGGGVGEGLDRQRSLR